MALHYLNYHGTLIRENGCMRVLRVVPKKESRTTYQVIEVEHSSNDDFSFALIKQFRMSDLVRV